jgi:hypothetical protein
MSPAAAWYICGVTARELKSAREAASARPTMSVGATVPHHRVLLFADLAFKMQSGQAVLTRPCPWTQRAAHSRIRSSAAPCLAVTGPPVGGPSFVASTTLTAAPFIGGDSGFTVGPAPFSAQREFIPTEPGLQFRSVQLSG